MATPTNKPREARSVSEPSPSRIVDLSHVISDGMITYPGLPTPEIATHLSREAAEEIYSPGTTFHIGLVTMCTNTGTYIDVPFHRFADGHDLTGLALERVAGVPGVCLDEGGMSHGGGGGGGGPATRVRAIDLSDTDLSGFAGHAVLIRTGHSLRFGTETYAVDHPFLTAEAAERLVAAEVACVGIDSLNIDSTEGGERPVHTTLLRSGIPIVEHLTNLDALPSFGFGFTAVPPKIEGAGTFTVRAFATVPVF